MITIVVAWTCVLNKTSQPRSKFGIVSCIFLCVVMLVVVVGGGRKNGSKRHFSTTHHFDRNMGNLGPIFQFPDVTSRRGKAPIHAATQMIFAASRLHRIQRREAGVRVLARTPPRLHMHLALPAPKTHPSPGCTARCGSIQQFYAPRSLQRRATRVWRTFLARFRAVFISTINRPILPL